MARFIGGSLRRKTLLAVASTSLLLALGLALPLRTQYLRGFELLERELARRHVERVRIAMDQQLRELATVSYDYATWDDACAFVSTPAADARFTDVNWVPSTFRNHRLAAVAHLDASGGVRWHRAFDGRVLRPGDDRVLQALRGAGFLRLPSEGRRGFASIDGAAWLVAESPVLRSTGEGPACGALLVARVLDRAEVDRLSHQLKLQLAILPATTVGSLEDPLFNVRVVDGSSLRAESLFAGPAGEPVARLRLDIPRDLYARGQAGGRLVVLAVVVAALFFGALVLWLLERLVLRRLARLGRDLREVATRADHSLRVSAEGTDELAGVATDVNTMLASLQGLTEEVVRARSMLREAFGRYVSEGVAAAVLASPEGLRLGGELREVTILFSDLRGYSTVSEHLDPREVVSILNEYFGAMSAVIDAEQGCVIEFLGDAILAVFGAPNPLEDHAERAVKAALGMHERTAALNRAWDASGRSAAWRSHGIERFQARIGVHTGRVVAGNLGSAQRVKYAVVGDAVNTASRVEALNNPLGTELLVTQATYDRLGESLRTRLVPAGEHAVKGRSEPVRVWTIK